MDGKSAIISLILLKPDGDPRSHPPAGSGSGTEPLPGFDCLVLTIPSQNSRFSHSFLKKLNGMMGKLLYLAGENAVFRVKLGVSGSGYNGRKFSLSVAPQYVQEMNSLNYLSIKTRIMTAEYLLSSLLDDYL